MVLNFWSLVAVNSSVFSDTKPPKIDTKVSKKMTIYMKTLFILLNQIMIFGKKIKIN